MRDLTRGRTHDVDFVAVDRGAGDGEHLTRGERGGVARGRHQLGADEDGAGVGGVGLYGNRGARREVAFITERGGEYCDWRSPDCNRRVIGKLIAHGCLFLWLRWGALAYSDPPGNGGAGCGDADSERRRLFAFEMVPAGLVREKGEAIDFPLVLVYHADASAVYTRS